MIELNLQETLAVVGGASASTAGVYEAALTVPVNETSLKAGLAGEMATPAPAPVTTTFSIATTTAIRKR